jgi:hypothetical protein
MQKEKLVDLIVSMDMDFYARYGEGEVLDLLRKYEKAIIHLCGLEEYFAKLLGIDANTIKESCKRAYEGLHEAQTS